MASDSSAAPAGSLTSRGWVEWIYDGDTVKVRVETGAWQKVRLIGINTPEVWPRPECGGPRAERSLRRLLPVGTAVTLRVDPAQGSYDRYGRELRYVNRASDGRDVGRLQVRRGLARVVDYYHRGFARLGSYRRAEDGARSAGRGSWRGCRWMP